MGSLRHHRHGNLGRRNSCERPCSTGRAAVSSYIFNVNIEPDIIMISIEKAYIIFL